MVKTLEKYTVTNENLQDTLTKLNEFCKGGFKKTHDWLRFNDKPDKTFEQLTFEKEYPVYEFTNEEWYSAERLGKRVLFLQQSKYEHQLYLIKVGAEIEFTENAIYVYDTEDTNWQFKWSCVVSKIYK